GGKHGSILHQALKRLGRVAAKRSLRCETPAHQLRRYLAETLVRGLFAHQTVSGVLASGNVQHAVAGIPNPVLTAGFASRFLAPAHQRTQRTKRGNRLDAFSRWVNSPQDIEQVLHFSRRDGNAIGPLRMVAIGSADEGEL